MQYIDNIKKWTKASLEENVSVLRLTEDRTSWRERSCAAGAANVRTDDADKIQNQINEAFVFTIIKHFARKFNCLMNTTCNVKKIRIKSNIEKTHMHD